jgi:CubicO group peptidase (beta-lactamase class C family)
VVRCLGFLTAAAVTTLLVTWNVLVYRLEHDRQVSRATPRPDTLAALPFANAIPGSRFHLNRLREEGNIPGLAVAVAVGGRIVWSEAIGFSNIEESTPVRRDTRFRIQSLSKSLTSTALMRLYDQGRIRLDIPIQTYVSSFPDKGYPITAIQLASHRAGIRAYRDDLEAIEPRHCECALDAVAAFRDDPLVFVPGTSHTYSNYGYQLLGAAMEGAVREPFPLLMRHALFDPLGMIATSEFRSGSTDPRDSQAYDFVTPYSPNGQRVVSPLIDFTCRWPNGGFLSTADDMVRFAAAHAASRQNSFLQSESLRLLFRPRTPGFGPLGVAMGWLVGRDWRLRRVCFNFGAGSGGRAFMAVFPEDDVAVTILANLGHARMDIGRLIGIVIPFLNPYRAPWPEVCLLLTVVAWGLFLWRRRKARSTA